MCSNNSVCAGIFGILLYLSVANAILPDYIKVCQRTDPELGKCIMRSIDTLRPTLIKGIPELEVPPLEPLILDRIVLNTGPTTAQINANMTNIKVHGPSTFIIHELIPKIEKNIFKFRASLPFLTFEGDYEVDMKILLINLKGKGLLTGNMTDYRFECVMKGHLTKRDGEEYLEFSRMKLRIGTGLARIHLANLFNGDPVLGRASNEVINDNADLFMKEITPSLENALSEKFTAIANKITQRFTYKELFPNGGN